MVGLPPLTWQYVSSCRPKRTFPGTPQAGYPHGWAGTTPVPQARSVRESVTFRKDVSNPMSATETAVNLRPSVREELVEVDRDLLDSTLEYIRPALQYDGGDLILEGVDEDGTVNLNLVGACSGCPMSMMTLTAGIERILKDRVPGVTAINAT